MQHIAWKALTHCLGFRWRWKWRRLNKELCAAARSCLARHHILLKFIGTAARTCTNKLTLLFDYSKAQRCGNDDFGTFFLFSSQGHFKGISKTALGVREEEELNKWHIRRTGWGLSLPGTHFFAWVFFLHFHNNARVNKSPSVLLKANTILQLKTRSFGDFTFPLLCFNHKHTT